jgi:hypothetical protein
MNDHVWNVVAAAATKGGGGIFLWIVIAFLVVCFPLSIIRYRARGPAVGWVPRRLRNRLNSWYTERGWEAPYDADGKKKQRW